MTAISDPSAASAPSAPEITERARAALAKAGLDLRLSPALPAHWPPRPGDTAALEWFAYQSRALPTGVIAYQVSGPVTKITIALPAAEPRLENISGGDAQGKETEHRPSGQAVNQAEQVLLDVLSGKRTASSAHGELAAYVQWAKSSSVIGPDLLRRKPEFFAWLDKP